MELIDSDHFNELLAFERIDPHPDTRLELYLAAIRRDLFEVNRSQKHKPTPYRVDEFLFPFGRKARGQQQGEAAIFAALAATVVAAGGSVPGYGEHREA